MRKPYGTVIYCDDIRQEVGGKTSYMGIYAADMIIDAAAPFTLPKLCIAAHVLIPARYDFSQLRIVVKQNTDSNETIIVEASGEIEKSVQSALPDEGFIKTVAALNAVQFEIQGPCSLKVSAFIDEFECKMEELTIRFKKTDTNSHPA
jgi:hypothetical protein